MIKDTVLEYKYIIRGKHKVTWEDGPNRKIDVSQYKDAKNICVQIEDTEFHRTKKKPKINVHENVSLLGSFL